VVQARRIAALTNSPFIKTDATMYTEVGFVGRDASEMIADLHREACKMIKNAKKKGQGGAEAPPTAQEELILDYLLGPDADAATKKNWLRLVRSGELDAVEVPTDVAVNFPHIVLSLIEKTAKASEGAKPLYFMPSVKRHLSIRDVRRINSEKKAEEEESETEHAIALEAKTLIEERGIIVIDEIDKIVRDRTSFRSADASDEGVQRDLLPIVEGTVVPVKHSRNGPTVDVRTDFILFIAAGAFSHCKPSDLLPEFQGRFPIRAELLPLTEEALLRILKEPKTSLVKQQIALMGTERLKLEFEDDALGEIARVACAVNNTVQNLGARRLSTILELVLTDVSFDGPELVAAGQDTYVVTKALVEAKTKHLLGENDVSKYIL